jgi:choline dehydrogenase
MCAGSIHTPQVLQLSGIGPAGQLRDYSIPVVADLLGVGQNMQVSSLIRIMHHVSS